MPNDMEGIYFAKSIVNPLLEQAPASYRHNYPLWATACLLVEPAINGKVDPDAEDFGYQAKQAIQEVTEWQLHHDRAEIVLQSGDKVALDILANACRRAKDLKLGNING